MWNVVATFSSFLSLNVQGLKSSVEYLVKVRDHGVSLKFIGEMASLGYRNLEPEALIRIRDHGVTPAFINEFVAAGYPQLSVDRRFTRLGYLSKWDTTFIPGLTL